MLAGRASRGRASEAPPPVRWGRVASVSQAGALVRAAISSAATLPESTASTFRRYKTALAAGSELALPFTADKIIGYLAVYCERWGQKSSSLKSVVMHLRAFADHFGFGWLPAADEAVVEKARLHLELTNPCEISHAAAVMEDGLERMLHALDKLVGAGNLWALMLAALISLAHDAATRLNEPTHALRKDIKVSDKGLYLTTLFNKGSKRFQDARTQTARASARPGSSRCVVARVRAYLEAANLAPEALLFPRREPSTGALVLSATGAPMLYTEYLYKRDFRALAAAAGIADAASLSPRGLRAGGAMDDRLAGLSSDELNAKIGWGAKKHAQPLYVRGNARLALSSTPRHEPPRHVPERAERAGLFTTLSGHMRPARPRSATLLASSCFSRSTAICIGGALDRRAHRGTVEHRNRAVAECGLRGSAGRLDTKEARSVS